MRPRDADVPSLDSAPSQKKSMSVNRAALADPRSLRMAVRLDTSRFFSCSNTVYCTTFKNCQLVRTNPEWRTCNIGLITSTNAGPTPLQNPIAPLCFMIALAVSMIPGFSESAFFSAFASVEVDGEDEGGTGRTAWVIWITQMGLEIIVVAEPG